MPTRHLNTITHHPMASHRHMQHPTQHTTVTALNIRPRFRHTIQVIRRRTHPTPTPTRVTHSSIIDHTRQRHLSRVTPHHHTLPNADRRRNPLHRANQVIQPFNRMTIRRNRIRHTAVIQRTHHIITLTVKLNSQQLRSRHNQQHPLNRQNPKRNNRHHSRRHGSQRPQPSTTPIHFQGHPPGRHQDLPQTH